MPRRGASNQRADPLRVLTVTPEGETVEVTSGEVMAIGGGLEGAERTSRATVRWNPSRGSPDQIINTVKSVADARGRDRVQNDGYALNALSIHRDGIVGSQYRLNANPHADYLGATIGWADEFQKVVEARFSLAAASDECWFDAQRVNTFTSLVRLAVGGFVMTGEVLASCEWIREGIRPFKTAVQMIAPDRLCNPNEMADTPLLRRGITRDARGKPLSYAIRQGYVTDNFAYFGVMNAWTWNTVPARTWWGRVQMIHILEQLLPDQSRGIADMVSVLKDMKMTSRFKDITLQNAVVNASYAAAIESELPDAAINGAMGGGQIQTNDSPFLNLTGDYLAALQAYLGEANNVAIDGVMIPHLFPGTKLNMKPLGTPGGIGTDFEASLLRHVAAGLGVSYEELAKDYSKVSYSSARTSIANTGRFLQARKKVVADRFANQVYALWLEEDWQAGNLPVPKGLTKDSFYDPLVKEAITRCNWIGAGLGQIDELKETQAAILRVSAGFTTYEQECAKFGSDWREVFTQQAREQGLIGTLNLPFTLSAKRPLGTQMPDNSGGGGDPSQSGG